jgi:hypothetical protein
MRDIKRVRQHGLVAAAGLAFLVVSLSQALGARTSVPMLWRGYITLVVSGSVPLETVVARLERRIEASSIVSAATSTVSITVFSGREEVAIADLGARLDTRDPRLDDYMRKLPAMFRGSMGGSPAHVLYIRTGMAPVFFSLRMSRLLRGLEGEWSIVELTPLRNLLYLLAALAFVALVVPHGRTPRTAVFLALASDRKSVV